ncbi:MAG: class I SAM-dependent DNA methyltransferase [Rhizobiaceae bacterium]
MAGRNEKADQLLEQAYSLKSDVEAKALYKEWAGTYDEAMLGGLGYLTPMKTAELLTANLADKNARILDIGSGTGLAGNELSRLGFANLDALDYSAEMLAEAAKRNIYNLLHEVDLTKPISIESGTYEAMICTGTFTHAHVGASCLDELFRILKPGGVFACTVHQDIWEPEGFEEKISQLEGAGIVKTVQRKLGIYFREAEEPEGWYILWEKLN